MIILLIYLWAGMPYKTRILVCLLILNLLRGTLYCITIPLWQGPDEHLHFEHVKLLTYRNFPNSLTHNQWHQEIRATISQSLMKHTFWDFQNINSQKFLSENRAFVRSELRQPPLYYSICAFLLNVSHLKSIESEVYLLRIFSTILGTVVVYLGYAITKEIFPTEGVLQIGVPMFITFLPQYTIMSSSINNDKFAEVLFSLLLLLLVRSVRYRTTVLKALSILAIVVMGIQTKTTFLAAIPLCLLFWLLPGTHRKTAHICSPLMLLLVGIGVLGGLLYIKNISFLRVIEHYTGMNLQHFGNLIHDEVNTFPAHIRKYAFYFYLLLSGFWARFGWLKISLHKNWYYMLFVVDSVGIAGLGMYGVKVLKNDIILESWQKKSLFLLASCVGFVLLQVCIRDNLGGTTTPHSRLLFVAIVPISLFFMVGIHTWMHTVHCPQVLAVLACALAGFDAMCFYCYIIPLYYGIGA